MVDFHGQKVFYDDQITRKKLYIKQTQIDMNYVLTNGENTHIFHLVFVSNFSLSQCSFI